MAASAANTSALIVFTGADMIELTAASPDSPGATTLSRRSTSVTMPSPLLACTRMAERPSAIIIAAASRMVTSGPQKMGLPWRSAVTGRVRTSGSAIVLAAWVSRSRSVRATNLTPSNRLRISRARSMGMQYSVESSRARAVNSGGSPVSRVGWPNTSPARDHINRHLIVDEIESPILDHIELGARHSVLDEHRLPAQHEALDDRCGDSIQLLGPQSPERIDSGEESCSLPHLVRAISGLCGHDSTPASPSASRPRTRRCSRLEMTSASDVSSKTIVTRAARATSSTGAKSIVPLPSGR